MSLRWHAHDSGGEIEMSPMTTMRIGVRRTLAGVQAARHWAEARRRRETRREPLAGIFALSLACVLLPASSLTCLLPPSYTLPHDACLLLLAAACYCKLHCLQAPAVTNHLLFTTAHPPTKAKMTRYSLRRLNGSLTRVRQMLCSPFVVNAARNSGGGASGGGGIAVIASTERLPHKVILDRLAAQVIDGVAWLVSV